MKKRLLSLFLVLCMVLTVFPLSALAAESDGAIRGTVVDIETQRPIEATVTLYARGNTSTALGTATANATTGEYALTPSGGIPNGQYTLVFTHNLYLRRSMDIEITSASGLIIADATSLYPVGRCDGTVTVATTGVALSGVTVNVYRTNGDLNISTTTGVDGKYSIETQAGIYNFEFVKNGYKTVTLERVSLGAIATAYNAKMALYNGGGPGTGNEGGSVGGEGGSEDVEPTPDASGMCGKSLTFVLYEGILTISGTGIMDTYSSHRDLPWYKMRDKIVKVVIEDGVTSIGDYAFSGCSNLKDIIIPNSISQIGKQAFSNCRNLSSISIPDSVKSIGDYAFVYCTALTHLVIPGNVTAIGRHAFSSCFNLVSVVISDGVLRIEEGIFFGCSRLNNVSIPVSVKSIEYQAFESCTSLKSIYLPNSIVRIVPRAFHRTALSDVYYSGNEEQWNAIEGATSASMNDLVNATIHYNSSGPNVNPTDEITFPTNNTFSVFIDGGSTVFASIPNASSLQKADIIWSSSDESVVKIESSNALIEGNLASATAVIRGVSRGTATMTITLSDGRTASCQITVNAEPNTIQLSYLSSIPVNTSKSLSAQIKLNTIAAGDEIVWTSSDSNILAFDAGGSASATHSVPTISTNSIVTDSVTLYGRGTGKVKVTCRMPRSGLEKSVDILVFKDESKVFEVLRDVCFEGAFTNYIQKVVSGLKAKQNKIPQLTIDQQAEELMKADTGNAKLVQFMGTYDATVQKNVYKAVAQYLADVTDSFDLSNINVKKPDKTKITLNIVKAIINGIDVNSHSYKCGGNVTVELKDGISAGGAHFRDIYYKKGTSKSVHVATLLSKPDQIYGCINEYLTQIMKLEEKLVKEAYDEVKNEFKKLGFKGLKTISQEKIAEKLGPFINAFEQSGTGKVVTAISVCKDYCDFVDKILGIAGQDPLSLLSDYDMIKKLSFEPESVDKKVMDSSVEGLEKAGDLVWNAFDQLIETGKIDVGELFKGWAKDTFTGIVNKFMCPVNVSVYTSDGVQVGYVGDDDFWYDEDVTYIEQLGETKTIYSHDGNLRFELVGTDDGILNCTFEEFTEGAAVSRVSYYDIELYQGKNISASVLDKTIIEENVVVIDENKQLEADLIITADDYKQATANIVCSVIPSGSGIVYGADTYICGDMVGIQAIAADGYSFVGWQDGNGNVMSTDDYYEFTAQEDLNLTAIFTEYKPAPKLYEVTFDGNGGTLEQIVFVTDVNGTLAELPIPTKSGFVFSGWYTQPTGGQKVTTETIFSENTTIYAQWTQTGGSTDNNPYYPGSSSSGSSSNNEVRYSVKVPATAAGGKVTVNPQSARKGSSVTITVTPNSGYELDFIKATSKDGSRITLMDQGDGKYSFTMPGSDVTLDYSFKLIETTLPTQPIEPIQPTTSFIDVASGEYYSDAVTWAVAKEITTGNTATTFGPNEPCTRGQIVTFLWRAAGSPASSGSNPFTDVKAGDYWYDAVLWAVSKGITNGTSATTFGPDDVCTRGQVATFLHRNAGTPTAASIVTFTDVAPDAYYSSAVAWALAEGITNGTTATTFGPDDQCTRGQIVTFLYRGLAK